MNDTQEDVCLLRPGMSFKRTGKGLPLDVNDMFKTQETPVKKNSHTMTLTPIRPLNRSFNDYSYTKDVFNTNNSFMENTLKDFSYKPSSIPDPQSAVFLNTAPISQILRPDSKEAKEVPKSINNYSYRNRYLENSPETNSELRSVIRIGANSKIKKKSDNSKSTESAKISENIEQRYKLFENSNSGELDNTQSSVSDLTNFDQLNSIFSQCILHDERFLVIDKTILFPGDYKNVTKVFTRNTDLFDTPEELKQAAQNQVPFICGHVANLSSFYWTNERMLYIWKWSKPEEPILKYELESTITAIGSLKTDSSIKSNSCLPEELRTASEWLLIATRANIVLWRVHCDSLSSVLTAAPTAFSQPVDAEVTCIVSHQASKKFFYADNYGTIKEFVIGTSSQIKNLRFSISNRISSWNNTPHVQTQTIIGCSTIAHYLGPWAGGRKAITKLVVDEHRGLLYSINVDSTIEVFGIFPPSFSKNGVVENYLQLLVSATFNQTVLQSNVIFSGATKRIEELKAMQKLKIVDLKPLGRHEGLNIIAVAFLNNGTRLYLESRFDTPVSLKNITHTHNPEISKFQYLKSLSLASWKSPPNSHENSNLLSVYYNNYTYVYGYKNSQLFITLDESNILEKQFNEPTRLLSEQVQYHEWAQEIPTDTPVLGIFEEVLDPTYKELLDGYGSLPGPYDVAERYHMSRIAEFYDSLKSKNQLNEPSASINVFEETTSHMFYRKNSSVWYIPRFEKFHASSRNEYMPYVAPSKLINSSSTQVLPGRSFVILTYNNVYCINQNRLFDLLILTADEILSMDPSTRSNVIQFILSPESKINSTTRNYIELLNSPSSTSYSIANLSQLSQLYTPEQIMSMCWQVLTYTHGSIKWPAYTEQTMHSHIKSFQNFIKPDHFQNRLLAKKSQKDQNNLNSVQFCLELVLHYISHYSLKLSSANDPYYIAPLNDVSSTSVYSNQIKGLLLYFSRLLRPVWTLPIFEPILISDVSQEALYELPALYRKFSDNKDSSKREENASAKPESALKKIKRFFGGEKKSPEEETEKQVYLALGCRFQPAEIAKLQKWLTQLSEAIHEIVNRILQSEKNNSNSKKLNWNARLQNEILILRSVESCAIVASELLLYVSYIISIKEFRELPASVFDMLAQASLQDLLFVKDYQQEIVKLLSLHIIQPSFVLQNCRHLFRPELLEFQLTIQTLVALHRQFIQPTWRFQNMSDFINPALNTTAALQTPSIQTAVKKILTIACQPESTIDLEYLSISTLLFELQFFEVLALFLCHLSQAFLSSIPASEHSKLFNDLPYTKNTFFTECRARYYHIVECILDYYLKSHEKYDTAQVLAERFVVVCFHVPVASSKSEWNTKSTKKLSREWFHNVILDWIHSDGKQTFPIPLSRVMSPVYSSWVSVHKHDLGPESANVLSEFFLSNKKYDEFVEFFAGIAKKHWTDPSEIIKKNEIIPNSSPITDSVGLERFFHAMDLKFHVCDGLKIYSKEHEVHRLSALQSYWNFIFKYIQATQHGLSLGYRQSYLLQARTSLESLLGEVTTIEQRNSLNKALKPLLHLLNMVQLQLSLLRQAMESAVYLFFSSLDIAKEIENTFSENMTIRQQTLERMRKNDTQISKYHQIQNIQSLFYMLQWKLYDKPADLLQLIKEFAEASKNQVLVPGLDLCVEPSLKSLLPNMSATGLSKQFIIYSAIACRGDLACWLKAPQILNDLTAKYLTMLFVCRVSSNEVIAYSSIFEDLLLFVPVILNVLHEAAATFQKILPPSPSEISYNFFDWELNYWMWPLMVFKDELGMVDSTISWNEERQVESQQKLPLLQALTDAYQQMFDNQEERNSFYLKKSHLLVLLLDVQNYWIQQLISMCTNLPYIHLLSERFNESRYSREETSSVVNCLNEMFRGSPHRMQKLCVKAITLAKACDAVISRTSNWFSQHEEHILNTADIQILDILKQITQNFLNNLERLEKMMHSVHKYVSLLENTQKYSSLSQKITPLRSKLQIA